MKHDKKITAFLILASIAAFLIACTSTADPSSEKMEITVSILPQKYFVERIGGDLVHVNVMVGPGEEPHTFEPQPSQMQALSISRIYFTIGVEFEDAWLAKFEDANPTMKIVDSSTGIEKMVMSTEEHVTTGEDAHPQGELDPHIWLSPGNVKIIAQTIATALSDVDPKNSTTYQSNLEIFLQDINTLDQDIRTSLDSLPSRQFITFHPAWGYFARDYNLEQVAIEVGGNEPSAAELANLINYARQHDIHFIFAEPEFSTKSAETIAQEIDGEVILISPLEENWLENMSLIAQTLTRVLQ
ncbi:MAG TPA: cation ABC transporter substrate-binding protein [Anaerolineaceae bacterium]|nr:cation ABC transporter substrate-binding protein [Anaerolineaceae bacterium]